MSLFLLPWCVGPVAAQTVEETANWIIKQTEANPLELRHSIDNGVLMSHVSMVMKLGGLGGGVIEKGIPIGEVTGIVYTHTSAYLSYTMTCDSPCAYLLDEPEAMRPRFLLEIYRQVDAGYVGRMNKALAHLVKLHGGHAKPVRAVAPKVAF